MAIETLSDDIFYDRVNQPGRVSAVLFTAVGCEPCKAQIPIFKGLSGLFPAFDFYRTPAESVVGESLGITRTPMIVVFHCPRANDHAEIVGVLPGLQSRGRILEFLQKDVFPRIRESLLDTLGVETLFVESYGGQACADSAPCGACVKCYPGDPTWNMKYQQHVKACTQYTTTLANITPKEEFHAVS